MNQLRTLDSFLKKKGIGASEKKQRSDRLPEQNLGRISQPF